MSNESTVLSFEDAKLKARGSRRNGAVRSFADRGYQSQTRSSSDSSLRYVFDMNFDEDADIAFSGADDLSNAELGVSEQDIASVQEEIGTASKRGIFSKFSDVLSAKSRARKKSKAERAFAKAFGSSSSSNANEDEGRPRAAFYRMQMGPSQKRATRMQSGSSASGGMSFSLPSISLPEIPKRIVATLCALGCVVLLVGMLYTPTQQYYQQMRERDRLTAEYEAIIDRNDSLQKLVDNLQTDEGIEDKAHAEFGLIKEGEKAGAVTGFVVDDPSDFKANIAPGSVPAPETWYSGVLDFLFGYSS